MIEILTPRLFLREHIPEDLDDYHRILTDPVVMRWLAGLRSSSRESTRARLLADIAEQGDIARTHWFFRIEDSRSGHYIGEIGFSKEETVPGFTVDLGYFILSAYWNRGITTEAAAAVIRYAFEHTCVDTVVAGCFAGNIGSERVMQKCGMTEDPTRRHTALLDGKESPRVVYRLEKADWADLPKGRSK